jgi:hypothetical protein
MSTTYKLTPAIEESVSLLKSSEVQVPGRLHNKSIYLCGPIENDPGAGDWRKTISDALREIEPTFRIWNPLIKPKWYGESDPHIAFDKELIFHNLYKTLGVPDGATAWKENERARSLCKGLVSSCDIVIARLSDKFTWGSIDELEIAISRKIPVFLWLTKPVGIYGLPGICDRYNLDHYVHFDRDSLLGKIKAINMSVDHLPDTDPEEQR